MWVNLHPAPWEVRGSNLGPPASNFFFTIFLSHSFRPAQQGRKPRVEQKGKCWLNLSLQYRTRSRNVSLSIFFISEFEERIKSGQKTAEATFYIWTPIKSSGGHISLMKFFHPTKLGSPLVGIYH